MALYAPLAMVAETWNGCFTRMKPVQPHSENPDFRKKIFFKKLFILN